MVPVGMIQRLIFSLTIAICIMYCGGLEKMGLDDITFSQLCVEDEMGYTCEQDSYLREQLEDKNLVLFRVENNVYDTLFLPLYRSRECGHIYFSKSDRIDYCHYENDSLVEYASGLIFLPLADTTFKVLKGEHLKFLAIAPCMEQEVEKAVYNFSFEADSIGHLSTIHLTYRTW